ncbi:MAG: site-specific integrase, partial [Veillonellales bacterium]
MDITEQFLKLIENESTKHRLLCLLGFTGGLRREEIFGLEWDDIDFEHNTVVIRQASIYVVKQGVKTKDPKTSGSFRAVSLPVEVIDLLKSYKEEWEAHKKHMENRPEGSKWQGSTRLFTTWEGKNAHPHSFNNWLRRFKERNELSGISPHIFRHMAATYLTNSGVDVATVSGKLGQTQQATTFQYSHLLKSAEQNTAKIMGDF